MSRSPISVLEHSVGMPTPRLTIQPSWNSQRDAIRHLLARQPSRFAHRRRSCRFVGQFPRAAAAPARGDARRYQVCAPSSGSMWPGRHDRSSSISAMVIRAAVAITGPKLRCERWNCRLPNGVGGAGADERVVQRQRVFQQVVPAVDHPRLAAIGKFGADRGRRVESRNAGAGSPQPFRQRALRHQFGIHLAGLRSIW